VQVANPRYSRISSLSVCGRRHSAPFCGTARRAPGACVRPNHTKKGFREPRDGNVNGKNRKNVKRRQAAEAPDCN